MTDDTLINVENISKRFCRDFKRSLWYGVKDAVSEFFPSRNDQEKELRKGEFWANREVSFEVKRGESIGLIGHNGAGKTTLLKMLNGLIKPDAGRIEVRGKVGALIALGAGFNPVLSGRENVYANGSILGLRKKEMSYLMDEIVEFAEVEDAIDSPVQNYSSGMQVRLGFAIAAFTTPDILLIDEVLAVGDVAFRQKCLKFVESLRERGGCNILVTHSFNQVLTTCSRAVLLHHGRPLRIGNSAEVIREAINLQTESDKSQIMSRNVLQKDATARIDGLKVVPDGENESVRSCESMIVELNYHASRPVASLGCSVSIYTQDNAVRLIYLSSTDVGHVRDVNAGSGVFRCRLNMPQLAPGRYRLRASIGDASETFDIVGYELNESFEFTVATNDSPSTIRDASVGALFSLQSEWLAS